MKRRIYNLTSQLVSLIYSTNSKREMGNHNFFSTLPSYNNMWVCTWVDVCVRVCVWFYLCVYVILFVCVHVCRNEIMYLSVFVYFTQEDK